MNILPITYTNTLKSTLRNLLIFFTISLLQVFYLRTVKLTEQEGHETEVALMLW